MKYNYYVIGGQYYAYCYGGSNTLHGAKLIAAKHEEFLNGYGWNRPKIYAAEDCVMDDTQFYGRQMIPKVGTFPVAVYEKTEKRWYLN